MQLEVFPPAQSPDYAGVKSKVPALWNDWGALLLISDLTDFYRQTTIE
jgi:hypothetical protein